MRTRKRPIAVIAEESRYLIKGMEYEITDQVRNDRGSTRNDREGVRYDCDQTFSRHNGDEAVGSEATVTAEESRNLVFESVFDQMR